MSRNHESITNLAFEVCLTVKPKCLFVCLFVITRVLHKRQLVKYHLREDCQNLVPGTLFA